MPPLMWVIRHDVLVEALRRVEAGEVTADEMLSILAEQAPEVEWHE